MLLLLTLVVTGLLTREGHQAADREQKAVERLLSQNAAFAAQRYAQLTESRIASLFGGLYFDHKDEPLRIDVRRFKKLSLLPRFEEDCGCDIFRRIEYQFAYDYSTKELFIAGRASEAERTRLIEILQQHVTVQFKPGWEMALAADAVLPSGLISGYAVRKAGKDAPPAYAIGFAVPRPSLTVVFHTVAAFIPTLPKGYTDEPSDDFAISVFSNGAPVLQDGEASIYTADEYIKPALGGYLIRAAVNPNAVPAMAGGAVPRPGLQFAGLMLLASVLIFSVLVLSKRESELARVRADFVSSVSHELRTPLAQIRMFTETLLLGRTRNDSERKRSLEIVDQEAKRLTALVENVLHISRAERGATRLTPAAMPLAPAVRDIVDTFAQLPRSRGLEYRTELEERLIAQVDPNAFRQILLNLLDNAVKYGPSEQRIHVGLAMFEQHARLWVDDQGPGIPVRERERVFETFYRSTLHAESKVVGTGIGLAVVRELARLLGGRVWAEDAPGSGARIVVEFPEAYLRAEEATGGSAVA